MGRVYRLPHLMNLTCTLGGKSSRGSIKCLLWYVLALRVKGGITTAEDAKESDNPHFSLAAPFESVGLGELAILISSSDRLIQF